VVTLQVKENIIELAKKKCAHVKELKQSSIKDYIE